MNIQEEYNLNIQQKYINRVFMWNEERGLLGKIDGNVEYRMLKEELDEFELAERKYLEALNTIDSFRAGTKEHKENILELKKWRSEKVDAILDICVVFIGACIKASINNTQLQNVLPSYQLWHTIVNSAFGDIVSLGVEPNCAFNECLLEIESRTGRVIEGKFQKWKPEDKEFTGNYKANYELCKLKEKYINSY